MLKPRALRPQTLAAGLGLLSCFVIPPAAASVAVAVEAVAPAAQPAPAQQYREGLHGVDLSGLSDEQRELSLTVLNDSGCRCGCGMTVAQCRVEDQSCPRSPLLARAIVDAVRRGGDEAAVRAAYRRAAGFEEPAATAPKGPGGAPDLKGSGSRGAVSAPVTLVEYSDFECGYCRSAQAVLKELLAENPATVRLVFKHFPLASHVNARPAALAAESARQQGKFWEMHDRLFADPPRLDARSLREHARSIGLDLMRFEKAMASADTAAAVDRDIAEGNRNAVAGTPAFFVNGRHAASYEIGALRSAISAALAAAPPAK